jgi:hypothetical protein
MRREFPVYETDLSFGGCPGQELSGIKEHGLPGIGRFLFCQRGAWEKIEAQHPAEKDLCKSEKIFRYTII